MTNITSFTLLPGLAPILRKIVHWAKFGWEFLESLMISATQLLNRLSKDYRYVACCLSEEKKRLKVTTRTPFNHHSGLDHMHRPRSLFSEVCKLPTLILSSRRRKASGSCLGCRRSHPLPPQNGQTSPSARMGKQTPQPSQGQNFVPRSGHLQFSHHCSLSDT